MIDEDGDDPREPGRPMRPLRGGAYYFPEWGAFLNKRGDTSSDMVAERHGFRLVLSEGSS